MGLRLGVANTRTRGTIGMFNPVPCIGRARTQPTCSQRGLSRHVPHLEDGQTIRRQDVRPMISVLAAATAAGEAGLIQS